MLTEDNLCIVTTSMSCGKISKKVGWSSARPLFLKKKKKQYWSYIAL